MIMTITSILVDTIILLITVILIIVLAATETAINLIIIINIYKTRGNIGFYSFNLVK
jgi:NADH:ubiquinone oxidoreductase subunit K